MTSIVLVGSDKIGRKFVAELGEGWRERVFFDTSSNFRRILKLIRRGVLSLTTILKMASAEMLRRDYQVEAFKTIADNKGLLEQIRQTGAKRVYLFRAGLIVNRDVLSAGVTIMNVHCAKIPEYGGLGSIERAIRDGAWAQAATMHVVTSRIDEGDVIALEPYELSPSKSYLHNENVAYEAGIKLLMRVLREELGDE
jgi:folate-dependent phosphoribosylglycinamide formyltransferase PurN